MQIPRPKALQAADSFEVSFIVRCDRLFCKLWPAAWWMRCASLQRPSPAPRRFLIMYGWCDGRCCALPFSCLVELPWHFRDATAPSALFMASRILLTWNGISGTERLGVVSRRGGGEALKLATSLPSSPASCHQLPYPSQPPHR